MANTEIPRGHEITMTRAEARVDINPDKTRAVLYLRKAQDGACPLETEAIIRIINDSGLRGVDEELIKAAIQTFMDGEELELTNCVLAEGMPSTRGGDREINVSAAPLPREECGPILARLKEWYSRKVSADKGLDPQKAAGFAFVEKDAVVASVSTASEGEPGMDVYGNVIPGLPGNDPDIKLYSGLTLRGSDIIASRAGLLFFDAAEKNFCGKVVEYENAKINVLISKDAMEARGNFSPEKGAGVPLTVANVQKALAAIGVTKGIDWGGVEKACIEARARGSISGHVIARGESPTARGASAVKWLVRLDPPELSATNDAAASAEGEVPKATTVQVKAGTPIVELTEPLAEGRPGYDVKGNEIAVDQGIVLTIDHDDTIQEIKSGEGGRLVAARSGELSFDGEILKISSVKTIQGNVGQNLGNVKFPGEIRISGNVLPGCAVIGGSHVIVDGLAEEAFISAGGKAVAALGFKGGGRGIIRAKAGIETAFTERAAAMAVGDIRLKRGSILSTIKTNGKLFIAAENGKLSGGVCKARYGVDAMDVGSEKSTHTEISFGQDYLIKDQITACEEEITKCRNSTAKAEEKVKNCLDNKLPLPDELRKEKVRLIKIQEQLNLKIFALREKFEEHYESEVRVRGTVFPGVVIECHGRYYEVKQKRSQVIFYFDRETGRIKEKPL